MRITLGELRLYLAESLNEFGTPKGSLRRVRGSSGRQHKIGKIEDENRELSVVEAERAFPGSTDAWAEVVPDAYPDFPFTDPQTIKARTLWFQIGPNLRTAFAEMPQVELMQWDSQRDDWFPLDEVHEGADSSMAGSRPEEHYSNELAEDEAWKKHSVLVPDDVKKPINSWMKQMGLAGAKKRKRKS